MKNLISSLTILFFSITICNGQINLSTPDKNEQETNRSCSNKVDNKSIILCNYKSDTITFDQLKSCRELVINNDNISLDGNNKKIIVSFTLDIILEDENSVIEFKGSDNKITDEMINRIIEAGANKILFEEILAWDGANHMYLGHRWYYLKNN